MKRSVVVSQPALPGFRDAVADHEQRAPRRLSHARVFDDPGVSAARAESDQRYAEWRDSFASFLTRLPARRRDELRRRLYEPDSRRRGAA